MPATRGPVPCTLPATNWEWTLLVLSQFLSKPGEGRPPRERNLLEAYLYGCFVIFGIVALTMLLVGGLMILMGGWREWAVLGYALVPLAIALACRFYGRLVR